MLSFTKRDGQKSRINRWIKNFKPDVSKFRRRIILLMIGVIFSMALSAMYVSGTWNLERFYDEGRVYEAADLFVGYGVEFNHSIGKMEVMNEEAYQQWLLPEKLRRYHYLMIKLDEISSGRLDGRLQYFKNSGELLGEYFIELENGENVVDILQYQADYVRLALDDQTGTTYEIKLVQYRKNLPIWSGTKFLAVFLISLAAYGLIALILCRIWDKKRRPDFLYSGIEKLQKVFSVIAEGMECRFLSAKTKSFIRKLLFFALIVKINLEEMNGTAILSQVLYKNIIIYSILLIIIALLSFEGNTKIRNWKNPLAGSWAAVSVCMIVSGMIVPKRFEHIGIVLLLVFGFLFFVWSGMEDKTALLKDFSAAVRWEFWLNMLYCFTQYFKDEYRYSGTFLNPNIFAMYASVAWIIFLIEIMETKAVGKKRYLMKCLDALGLGTATCMIWKTQCRTALLGIGLVILILLVIWKSGMFPKREYKLWKQALLLGLIILGAALSNIGTEKIPNHFLYADSERELYPQSDNIFETKVYAAENSSGSRIIESFKNIKSFDSFTSGRIMFWKAYLKQMNLLGHKYRAVVNDQYLLSHNAILSFGYEYGAFSVIAYICFFYYYIKYSVKYLLLNIKTNKYAIFPLVLFSIMLPAFMVENMEQPFRMLGWFAVYFTLGVLFNPKTPDQVC